MDGFEDICRRFHLHCFIVCLTWVMIFWYQKYIPSTPHVPHSPREGGAPPPPSGRLPSDGPPQPQGNRTTNVHAHYGAYKLHQKMKQQSWWAEIVKVKTP